MTLDQLSPGSEARIRWVGGSSAFRRRLMELGLLPGTHVRRTGQAILGDPLTYQVRGAVLGLRRVDARAVEVEQ